MDEPYRSYVVRIQRGGADPSAVQLDIEDLQGGARIRMRGAVARRLARLLVRLMSREVAGRPG